MTRAAETGRRRYEFERNSRRTELFADCGAGHRGETLSFEFILREAAKAEVVFLEAGAGVTCEFSLEREASLRVFFLSRDGAVAEHRVVVKLRGGGTEALFGGLSVLSGTSRAAYSVTMDHESGFSKSEQFFKSVLSGRSSSDFASLVSVRPGAQKSDSRQLVRNLLLSEFAQAGSRPELRILADDVSCSHGSATGRIEESELFYLRSRGLSELVARKMLVEGFAREAVERIEDARLRSAVEKAVLRSLQGVVS